MIVDVKKYKLLAQVIENRMTTIFRNSFLIDYNSSFYIRTGILSIRSLRQKLRYCLRLRSLLLRPSLPHL